jgi:hypothetical protein
MSCCLSLERYMAINTITKHDVEQRLSDYVQSIENVGSTIPGLKGISLIKELKRGKTGLGPYPEVSLFESANRIMTDLVILQGVRWLLAESRFGFDSYTVEYGNQNNNDYDIAASNQGRTLIGEAFNVAPSFFQGKKAAMLKKLQIDEKADVKLIMFNHDAVKRGYRPTPRAGVHFVFVDVGTGECGMVPS